MPLLSAWYGIEKKENRFAAENVQIARWAAPATKNDVQNGKAQMPSRFLLKNTVQRKIEKMYLQIKDLYKCFRTRENISKALKGVPFSVDKGWICVLLGPSGSGKSTVFFTLEKYILRKARKMSSFAGLFVFWVCFIGRFIKASG